MATKKLYRNKKNGEISGVCAGLADYFDIDVTIIRVLFVLGIFITSGFMILGYFALAIVMPSYDEANKSLSLEDNMKTVTAELSSDENSNRLKNIFGLALVVLGLWLLVAIFIPTIVLLNWEFMWPLVLIFVGLVLIVKRRN